VLVSALALPPLPVLLLPGWLLPVLQQVPVLLALLRMLLLLVLLLVLVLVLV
jgi:hypothetical protein